jgi:hypothetical protein
MSIFPAAGAGRFVQGGRVRATLGMQEDGAGTVRDPQGSKPMSYAKFAPLAYKLSMKVKAMRT